MKNLIIITIFGFLVSCKSEPSLQKYFVENSENKEFVSLDVSPSILNLNQDKLSISQKEAIKSFDKMNILAFRINDRNKKEYPAQLAKVTQILKNPDNQLLMKMGSGKEQAAVYFVGDENHINEFVIFGNQKETGFGVIRVLGKDMNVNSILEMISTLKESKIDSKQLEVFKNLLQKDTVK